ncbi:Protein CBG20725 [Caenorhabditis briggsae]|uniref:RGS domain-containing protein n=2 Tax=Caenorhabditis briggsae TaxID=6238 RepID=A0AAE9D4Y1_CAEBR|nr:Protein CBG20725 [Caenorhabditis briggsae]ULT92580.1 hypothetical protein L3Y34_009987 [Caenorhabditis briggsae]UMM38332.1 hypothetical protein L5515_009788 [Caenorhabditis briggsae]CAP37685.1 Protein CBG20725 [Caenorhabditis briggsae]
MVFCLFCRPSQVHPDPSDHPDPLILPPPSLTFETVNGWSVCLSHLIATEAGQDEFEKFLLNEHSEDNLLFWKDVQELKKGEEEKKDVMKIEEQVSIIFDDYIAQGAPKEVSIRANTVAIVKENMKIPNKEVFDLAQQEIFDLMSRDSYIRYISSPSYQKLLDSVTTTVPLLSATAATAEEQVVKCKTN